MPVASRNKPPLLSSPIFWKNMRQISARCSCSQWVSFLILILINSLTFLQRASINKATFLQMFKAVGNNHHLKIFKLLVQSCPFSEKECIEKAEELLLDNFTIKRISFIARDFENDLEIIIRFEKLRSRNKWFERQQRFKTVKPVAPEEPREDQEEQPAKKKRKILLED